MNLIIPMAGWGTRLRPHTLTVPKPLIKVAGKSVVQRLVETIGRQLDTPFQNIVFVIKPEFGPAVEKRLLDLAERLGARGHIRYQKEALGTAHAIAMAREFLQGPVFVAYADTLFDGAIRLDPSADSVIVVKRVERPEQFGVVQLDDAGLITRFVEKPEHFVSDLAIVGIYYFRRGEQLRDEIDYLLRENIRRKGEYQLTDALENMLRKGLMFMPATIERWMDFGNYRAALDTNRAVLDIESRNGTPLVDGDAVLENVRIHPPVYIGPGVQIKDSEIGPYVSVHSGCRITGSRISHALIGEQNHISGSRFSQSMIGNHTRINALEQPVSLGDYSEILNKS